MRITKRTNIAMRVLMFCAANPTRMVTKAEIAARCNASENHLAQVINQLAQMGYLHTQRGRNGGLQLARPASDIVIGEIFRKLEAPVPLAECFADVDNTCPLTECCRLRSALTEAAEAFYRTLDPVTLDGMVCGNVALLDFLSAHVCEGTRQRPLATLTSVK
ncbi:BadM/Rrf2 family transcriptional regulator [Primorskyibacter sedentarius]|uniref:BadM/Rrf2 family transcriptional regulator n=1 Tax=Primorskyibacter sedentarius TaxID=745311 RepID=A0A4R3JKQ1_9RHOB|nr:Rrf2 family transcriptional regulator [Primorskyibacter sedentarius]TCS65943.1 BadM/Rrf2 family transcriptional regulator [Primorskyibacter sedentarius]